MSIWKKVGTAVADFAPLLGTAVGGPLGGGIGTLLADAFGTEDEPEAVLAAIKADPNAAVKLQKIQSDEKVRLQEVVANERVMTIQAVNETMRTEAKSEHWMQWAWRPLWGIISAVAFFVICCFVCYLAYQAISGKDPAAIGMIPQLVGSMTMLFGVPGAILGVASWHRGQQKRGN